MVRRRFDFEDGGVITKPRRKFDFGEEESFTEEEIKSMAERTAQAVIDRIPPPPQQNLTIDEVPEINPERLLRIAKAQNRALVDEQLRKTTEKIIAQGGPEVAKVVDFVGGAIDILSGGVTLEEAERHSQETIEKAKRIPGAAVDLIKFVGENMARDLRIAEKFVRNPIEALSASEPPEKTIPPDKALEGFSNIIEFIFNPAIKSARAIGGFLFPEEEGTLKARLTQAAADIVKDPGIGVISERIGEDVFTGEEETLERIAKIGGVAAVGTIAEILTFNPRGVFNRIKRLPTDQKIARMNEIIAEVDKDLPVLKQVLQKVRPDLPPNVIESLDAQMFVKGAAIDPHMGNYLKAVTDRIVPRFNLASERGTLRFSKSEQGVPLKSNLQAVAESIKMPNVVNAQQGINTLKNSGLTKEEIEFSGVEQFLKDKGKVTKEELVNFIEENKVQVETTVLGQEEDFNINPKDALERFNKGKEIYGLDEEGSPVLVEDEDQIKEFSKFALASGEEVPNKPTKYKSQTLPGGENYQEHLVKLPEKDIPVPPKEASVEEKAKFLDVPKVEFESSHWDEPNVVVHIRTNERIDADGKKVLFVEEIQSDWHAQGKKKGYQQQPLTENDFEVKKFDAGFYVVDKQGNKQSGPHTQEGADRQRAKVAQIQNNRRQEKGSIPNAPFKNSWHELGLKEAIRVAVEGGFDKVAWISGAQTADRYDLSKQISKIDWGKNQDGTFDVSAVTKEPEQFVTKRKLKEKDIEEFIGKDLAKKIVENPGEEGIIEGTDLKVGGEWAKKFYDNILPKTANKYIKKWGGKVEDVIVGAKDFVDREYEGPTYTLEQLEKQQEVIGGFGQSKISPFTGEEQAFVISRVANSTPLRKIIAMMKEGVTFESAIEKHGTGDFIKLIGGKLVDPITEKLPQQGFTITPQMRLEVQQVGQPLFGNRLAGVGAEKLFEKRGTAGVEGQEPLPEDFEGKPEILGKVEEGVVKSEKVTPGLDVPEKVAIIDVEIGAIKSELTADQIRQVERIREREQPPTKISEPEEQISFEFKKTNEQKIAKSELEISKTVGEVSISTPGGAIPLRESPLALKFQRTGFLTFPDKTIEGPEDAAFAFQHLKNETVENFFIVAIKKGRAVSAELITTGTYNSASPGIFELFNILKKSRADSFYFVHNHPSGNVEFSSEDMKFTKEGFKALSDSGFNPLGHVIINDGEFGHIDTDFDFQKFNHKEFSKTKKVTVLRKYVEWLKSKKDLGPSIDDSRGVFEIAKGLQIGKDDALLFALNTENKILNVFALPQKQISSGNIQSILSEQRAGSVILVNSGLGDNSVDMVAALKKSNIAMLDDIDVEWAGKNPTAYKSKADTGVFEPSPEFEKLNKEQRRLLELSEKKDLAKEEAAEETLFPEGEAELLREFNQEINQLTSELKKNIRGKIRKSPKDEEEQRLIPKGLFAKEGGEVLDSLATENATLLGSLGYEATSDGLREFIQDNFGQVGAERAAKQRARIAEASTRDDLKKLVARIGKKLEKPLKPGKVKTIVKDITEAARPEKKIVTTERQALKKQIRDLARGARLGFRSGKDFQKAVAQQKEAIRLARKLKKVEDQIEAAIEIEEAVPAPFSSESSSFNEHVNYFQNIQLPPGSTLRGILKRIRTITRLRNDRKIPSSTANNQLRNLRRDIFAEAKKEDVAIRMTEGGKIVLAIRESGVFVPVEFAEYPNFKDLSAVAGGGTDITRTIQGIDGSLSIREKLKLPGQSGAAEQAVLWPTRDMSIQKLNYIPEKSAILKRIFSGIKRNSLDDETINLVAEQISLNDLNTPIEELAGRPGIVKITDKESLIKIAQDLRKWYTDTLAEQNAMRDIRNQPLIPVREKYTPHEFLDMTIWERFGRGDKVAKDVVSGVLPDYVKPNKPFNAREKAREFGIPYDKRVKSAISLSESYLATAGKDIFNTSIIQNNKAFIQQLETMGFKKSASTLADWTAEAYGGISPVIDKAVKLEPKFRFDRPIQTLINKRGMAFFNRLRNMAVFPFNFSWNLLTQTSSFTTLTVTRFGALNAIKGAIRWTIDPRLRERTSKEYYSAIVKGFKGGRMSRQDVKNLLGEEIKIYKTADEVVEDFAFLVGDNIERILTGASIEAARIKGETRGLKGDALKNFASDGGGKTQSMYNDEDKPGVLRSLTVKTAFPYQTFAFEVQNTLREWLGKTGTPPDDAKERIFWLIRFMAGATISASFAKKFGKNLWDWTRPALPFAEMWLSPIISKITGEYYDAKRALPSPIQTTVRFAEGIDNVLEKGDWRKLRNQMITWAPGLVGVPGGVQAARMVDSWIAYAEGGVFDRGGRKMFSVENEADLLAGMFAGVWSTQGGQEYIEKRKSEPLFQKLKVDDILDNILGKGPEERKEDAKEQRRKKRLKKKSSGRLKTRETRRFNFKEE